jgi:hypothetical protein
MARTLASLTLSAIGSIDFRSKLAELPDHVLKEGIPWLLSGKAVLELFVKAFQFLNEICDVLFLEVELGNRIWIDLTPALG